MSNAPATPQAEEAPAGPPANGRRKRLRIAVLLLLIVVGAAFGFRYWLYARAHESTDDAFLEGHVIPVSPRVPGHVLKVHVTDNQPVKAGDLLVELDPRDFQVHLDGARAALRVAEGRRKAAEKGVDLTRVTTGAGVDEAAAAVTGAQAGIDTAKAQVEASRSRVEQARAQRAAAEAVADQAQAEVEAVQTEASQAQADWQRYQEAIQGRGVSQQQLAQAATAARAARARLEASRRKAAAARAQADEARAAEQTATGSLKQAEAQLSEAEARLGAARSRLAGAKGAPYQVAASSSQAEASQAEVEQARAAVERADLELSYTKIYAPESGRVTRKTVEEGAYVQVGQALLAVVPEKIWVVANFKETQLGAIRVGQPVEVRVDAYPDRVFKAHVDSVQSGTGARFSLLPPENATGNYVKVVQRVPVKIVFDEALPPELHLAPGMSVVPEVRLQ